jgi:arsenite-transporting ATPase
VSFTADLAFLADQGADIARHNLANDPMAFASDETVRAFLQVAGSEGLPLTTVDGVTVMTGTYPSREQLTRFTGLSLLMSSNDADDSDGASSECGPTGCC